MRPRSCWRLVRSPLHEKAMTKKLLGLAAVLESVTGLGMMIAPAIVARLLLGDALSGAGAAVGRVAGVALLSLGLACWPGREAVNGVGPALRAMLTYNTLVTLFLFYRGVGTNGAGSLLWPAAAVHAVLTALFVIASLRELRTKRST